MNIEIETKVKIDSHELVIEKLKQNNAVLLADIKQIDVYFDDTANKLSGSGEGLRIRQQVAAGIQKVILTYKGQRQQGQYKVRSEYETEVGDYEMMVSILISLGFEKSLAVEKKRQLWQLDDCEVCLDEVELLGKFVEVEGPSEASINKVLDMIGLESFEHIQSGYAKMLWQKLDQRGQCDGANG
jgi:adenylate cyclase, class 2